MIWGVSTAPAGNRGGRAVALARPAALVAAAALWALACNDKGTEPPVPATVTITPAAAELSALESTVRFRAEIRDQHGRVMDESVAAWTSSDASVAVVDSVGLVKATGNGSATITAKAGEGSGSGVVTVAQKVAVVTVSPATGEMVLKDTLRLGAEALDANGHAVLGTRLSWASEDGSVATVDESGLVTGVGEGSATITASAGSIRGAAEIRVAHPDRGALEALYRATDGPNWVSSDHWLTDAPVRDWHGVTTDGSGRVVRLVLAGRWDDDIGEPLRHGLFGRLPPELGDLVALEDLHLGYNQLFGPLPPELGDLANLEALTLHENQLSGPLPKELGNLANLATLHLHVNDLSGTLPPELGSLASLETLSLNLNQLSGPIPPEIGELASLERLALSENELSGALPPELGDLAKLEVLSLYRNRLSGPIPAELGDLDDLLALELALNDLSGPIPRELGGLESLSNLNFAGNEGLAGALPSSLTDLGLDTLLAGGTGLCAPREPAFESWLRELTKWRIARCGEAMAYLVQAVQSRTHPVPLVEGEKALLRVFVTAAKATEEGIPLVRASFFVDGTRTHRVDIPAKSTPIPTKVDEGDLSKSANIEVPGRIVEPGLEMVLEIDPEGTLDEELGVPKRIPEKGRMAVEVREMPVFELTAIPFLWEEDPDSAVLEEVDGMEDDPEGHELLEDTRILLPVGEIDVAAHESVVSTSNSAFDLLSQTEAARVLEDGEGHYMGMMSGPVARASGVAFVPGRSSFSVPNAHVIAHELGHNMSLLHAPCGDPFGADPLFPDRDGAIGAWGYDFREEELVPPARADLMSYCSPSWVGDYHFAHALRHRLSDEDPPPAPSPAGPSLLLWGGVRSDGSPFLNPVFVADAPAALPDSGGDYAVTGWNAGGAGLFSLTFAIPAVVSDEEAGAFAFVLPARPEWEGELAGITLSGPDARSAKLDAYSDRPMAILLDSRTGRVRAFLRNIPDPPAADPGMEVLFSRGIPAATEWRR